MQRFMLIPPRDPGATRQRAGGLGLFFSYDLSAGEVPVGYLDRDTDLNRGAGEPGASFINCCYAAMARADSPSVR